MYTQSEILDLNFDYEKPYTQSEILDLNFDYEKPYTQSEILDLNFDYEKPYTQSEILDLMFEKESYTQSEILDLTFNYEINYIQIFNNFISRSRFYGITISNRKNNKTENWIGSLLETVKENLDFEYQCKFQWISKENKDSIVSYIKQNSGKELLISKDLFFEFEGGNTEIIEGVEYVKVYAEYDTITLTPKGHGYFDLTIKLKSRELYSI